jgi:hypothetical protein
MIRVKLTTAATIAVISEGKNVHQDRWMPAGSEVDVQESEFAPAYMVRLSQAKKSGPAIGAPIGAKKTGGPAVGVPVKGAAAPRAHVPAKGGPAIGKPVAKASPWGTKP